MGFVDRGGGREAKGTSLRRSKKNPGAPTTKNKGAHKNYVTPTTRASPTPPPACAALIRRLADGSASSDEVLPSVCAQVQRGELLHVDTAVALLSRKLEEDQEGIFRRAIEEGKLCAALCWSNEVEKQQTLLDTCEQHNKLYRGIANSSSSSHSSSTLLSASPAQPSAAAAGRHVRFQDDVLAASPVAVTTTSPHAPKAGVILYAVLGIHVNSIDRVNMRLHDQWIKDLEANVKHADVLGVLSGLNLSRDRGTHYAQERLLKECWRVAAEAHLPLVLHLYAADSAALTETVNRAAELLQELLVASTEAENSQHHNNTKSPTSSAAKKAPVVGPSAVVLYNGLTALDASPAMQQLVRTHRPCTSITITTATTQYEPAEQKHEDLSKPLSSASAAAASVVPFYVLVTAEGLAERAADAAPAAAGEEEEEREEEEQEEGGAAGKTGAAASVERLSSLLPTRDSLERSCTGGPRDERADAAMQPAVVDLAQLLIGTGAPWGTPQNLPDPYLCSLPNEPGNYHYVVQTIFDAMRRPGPTAAPLSGQRSSDAQVLPSSSSPCAEELAACVLVNQLRVFFHECIEEAKERIDKETVRKDGEAFAAAEGDNDSSSPSPSNGEEGEDEASGNGKSDDDDDDADDNEKQQQRAWAASQQPAAATAVAGNIDRDAKRDLEALLAEAAQERQRVEEERLREEAAREQARSAELQEKRNKREKKKNVKANNRSNFTHFRNKDFAPRQSKQEKLAHQRMLEGYAGAEGDSDNDDDDDDARAKAEEAADGDTNPRRRHNHENDDAGDAANAGKRTRKRGSRPQHIAGSSGSDSDDDSNDDSSSDSDEEENGEGDMASGSLAAEVELLLKEAEEKKRSSEGGCGRKGKNKNKNEVAAAAGGGSKSQAGAVAPSPSPPRQQSGGKTQGNRNKNTSNNNNNKSALKQDSEEEEEEASESSDVVSGRGNSTMTTNASTPQSRRQRRRQQKRQQQQQQRKDDDSDDD